jgi:hypothetical protein
LVLLAFPTIFVSALRRKPPETPERFDHLETPMCQVRIAVK